MVAGGDAGSLPDGEFILGVEKVETTKEWSKLPFFSYVRVDPATVESDAETKAMDPADASSFRLYESHGDVIRKVPERGTLLATSRDGLVEAFSYGPRVLALQSHPEFGLDRVSRYQDEVMPL